MIISLIFGRSGVKKTFVRWVSHFSSNVSKKLPYSISIGFDFCIRCMSFNVRSLLEYFVEILQDIIHPLLFSRWTIFLIYKLQNTNHLSSILQRTLSTFLRSPSCKLCYYSFLIIYLLQIRLCTNKQKIVFTLNLCNKKSQCLLNYYYHYFIPKCTL